MKTWQIGALVGGVAVVGVGGYFYYDKVLRGKKECEDCTALAREGILSEIVDKYEQPCDQCAEQAISSFPKNFIELMEALEKGESYRGMSQQEMRDEYASSVANLQIIKDRAQNSATAGLAGLLT